MFSAQLIELSTNHFPEAQTQHSNERQERTPLQILLQSEYPKTSPEYAEQWRQVLNSVSGEAIQENTRRQTEAMRAASTASTEGELDRSWSSESSHKHPVSGTPYWREFRERERQRRRYRRGSSAEAPMLASEDWASNHGSSGTGTPQSFSTAQSVLERPRDQQDSPTASLLIEGEAQHDDPELGQLLDALNSLTRHDKSTIFGKLEQELFHIDSDMASSRSEGSISDVPLMIREMKTELAELSQSLKGYADSLKAEIKSDLTKNLNVTADRLEYQHREGLKALNTDIRDDLHYMKVDLEDATRDVRHLKEISRANGGDLTFLTYDIASVKNTLSAHVTAVGAEIEYLRKVSDSRFSSGPPS